MRSVWLTLLLVSGVLIGHPSTVAVAPADQIVQFVFTSDSHFGITRKAFRGHENVDAAIVNEALVAAMNALPANMRPKDGGIGSNTAVGAIDFVVDTGDIANRQETTDAGQIQPASVSWAEFERVYLKGVQVANAAGQRAPVFVVPGNHDVSNAIGFHSPMAPAVDASSFVSIYNLMMRPSVPLTPATFSYPRDRVQTTRDIGGVHFMFLTMWPDSATRAWIARDLETVAPGTPVMLFTHDQPDAEGKHFLNPNGAHDINPRDKFENLLVDQLADGRSISDESVIEQRDLETFLTAHPHITAYFHGNSNGNQFYDWTGPDHTASVHTFRVDSPMKGNVSAADETRLSFQLVTIDMVSRLMTAREVLWNAHRGASSIDISWGGSTTVALTPRPVRPTRR